MKIKNKLTAVFTVLCALFIISGCQDYIDFPVVDEKPGEANTFLLTINNADGRTIFPVISGIVKYVITFTAEGKDPITETWEDDKVSGDITLPVGTYTLDIKAYIAGDKLVAEGSRSITIPIGSPIVNVNLAPIETGKGTFKLDFSGISDKITIVKMTGIDEKVYNFVGGSPNDPLEMELDADVYDLVFEIGNDSGTIKFMEILYIYQNLTSTFAPDWDYEDFKKTLIADAAFEAINKLITDNKTDEIVLEYFTTAGIKGVTATNLPAVQEDLKKAFDNIDALKEFIDVFLVNAALNDPAADLTSIGKVEAVVKAAVLNGSVISDFDWGASVTTNIVIFNVGSTEITFNLDTPIVTGVSIIFDGDPQIITVTGVEATVTYLPDGSGYIIERNLDWEASYAWFKLDLGSAKVSSIESIKFTYTGLSGDVGFKTPEMVASATQAGAGGSSDNVAAGTISRASQVAGVVDTAYPVTFTIDANRAAVELTGEVYFSIFINGSSPQMIQVSNIEFVKGDPCGTCSSFPCTCFFPVENITGVPTRSLPGAIIVLPTLASPPNATNRNIVWSILDDDSTGVQLDGNQLKDITTAGTIKVKAVVANGTAIGTAFEYEFDIVIDPMPTVTGDIIVEDFSTRADGYGADNIGGNTWLFGAGGQNFQRAVFNVGRTISGDEYESVRIVYVADKNARFYFFNEGVFQGTGEGSWIALLPNVFERTIAIPAGMSFNQLTFENTTAGPAVTTILSAAFVEKDTGGVVLPSEIIDLGDFTFGSAGEAQRGWDVNSIIQGQNEVPTHLLIFASAGGDGLGGVQVVLNSTSTSWAQQDAAPGWSFDGGWAGSPKLFIIDLTLLTQHTNWSVQNGYNELIIGFNSAANGYLLPEKVTSAYLVFNEDKSLDDLFYGRLIADNEIANGTNPIIMWYIDDMLSIRDFLGN